MCLLSITGLLCFRANFYQAKYSVCPWPSQVLQSYYQTLPKTPQGWVQLIKVTCLGLITNLDQISSSESRLKNQFLNQTSASPINLKFKISTKHSFRIATKIQLHNLYKTSAAKCWTNSSFKILPELQLQNLDQTLCSKSEQKLSFMTKFATNCCQHVQYQQQ